MISTIEIKPSKDENKAKNRPENPPKSTVNLIHRASKSSKASSCTQQANKITRYFDTQ